MSSFAIRKRYMCPQHLEKTGSAVVYGNRYYCFGCGAQGPASDLGESYEPEIPRPPENLQAKLAYIDGLPRLACRGLFLPTDHRGYYIVWGGRDYYKLRVVDPGGSNSRYLSPTGHKKPIFVTHSGGETLILVEGEINALSIAQTRPEAEVASPGSAGNFSDTCYNRYLPYYRRFAKIIAIVDKDAAGVKAAIEFKAKMQADRGPQVEINAWSKDANDVLVQDGLNALEEKVREAHLGVPRELRPIDGGDLPTSREAHAEDESGYCGSDRSGDEAC